MTLGNKLIVLLGSLIAMYFAVWLGDSFGIFASSNEGKAITGLIGLAAILGSFALTIQAFRLKLSNDKSTTSDVMPYAALMVAAFTAGAFATPITTYGSIPWEWRSGVMFFIVAALVPVVIDAKDIIVAMREKRRGDVVSMRRAA